MKNENLENGCLYAEQIKEQVKDGERMILFLRDGQILNVDFVSVEEEKEEDKERVYFRRVIWLSSGVVSEILYVENSDISACLYGNALDIYDCLDEYLEEDNLEMTTKMRVAENEVFLSVPERKIK